MIRTQYQEDNGRNSSLTLEVGVFLLEEDTTKKSCKRCLAKMRQRASEYRMKKGIMPRVLFDGTERCVICGKQEIVKGYKMCNKHLPIFQKTMLKNRKQINNYFIKANRAFWEAKNATN